MDFGTGVFELIQKGGFFVYPIILCSIVGLAIFLQKMWILRKLLQPMDEIGAIEFLLDKLAATKTNSEFFDSMKG